MMKSAPFKAFFRESAVGVSRYLQKCGISLRSLPGQSQISTISPARNRHRYKSGKVLALYCFTKSECGWYRGKMFFRPESRNGFGTFILFKIIFYIFERNFRK